MANKPLVLKRWQPNMQFLKGDLARVPVWVRLYNVPLEYWTIKGLRCVATAIGVPLYADHTTLLRKRLSYTRVCVEIDASKMLVKEYDLRCPNRLFITISADYEWIPLKCKIAMSLDTPQRYVLLITLIILKWWQRVRGM